MFYPLWIEYEGFCQAPEYIFNETRRYILRRMISMATKRGYKYLLCGRQFIGAFN